MPDPLAGSSWSTPSTVAGFVRAEANATLMRFAEAERDRAPAGLALDIGCGAGRNAVPLARQGWRVLGTDLSWPMLSAARDRMRPRRPLSLAHAPMDALPVRAGPATSWSPTASGTWRGRWLSCAVPSARPPDRGARRGPVRVHVFAQHAAPDTSCVPGEPFIYT